MAASAISSSLHSKQQPRHPQQGYAAPNPPQPGNLSISAYRQISTVEVMTAPYISPTPYRNQRSPHPQQAYITPNPSHPGKLAISADMQISNVEVINTPSISPPPYPNQRQPHPQQAYSTSKRSQSDSQLYLPSQIIIFPYKRIYLILNYLYISFFVIYLFLFVTMSACRQLR